MAYLDTQHAHKRLAGVTGVALIHIALAVGLVAGLTVKGFAPTDPPIITGHQFPLPEPPPPEDVPPPETAQPNETASTPPVASTPPIVLGPPPVFELTSEIPPFMPVIKIPEPRLAPAVESSPPAFTPRGPLPRNGPTGWVTTNDYPTRALHRGWEGTVDYALEIGTNGRVEECRILSNTGHEVLGEATCRWVERRARFDAATDGTGAEVTGSYRGAVTWQIPED